MADSVIIKINGDIKDYTAKLEAVQKQTEDLSKSLNKIGVASAVAFAVTTAGIIKVVDAFKESLRPGVELENILKNQGLYSEKLTEEYANIAKELKNITGVDDDVIASGEAVIQRFVGQEKVTRELTAAILDFAAGAKIDTVTAFNLVGKSIGTANNALDKYGIEIGKNLTIQEKINAFIAGTNAQFKDQAQVLNQAIGPLGRLNNAFGDIQKKIGEQLAPAVDAVASSFENLAKAVAENETTAKVIAAIALGIATLAGGALILSQLATAFVAVTAAAAALGVTIGVLTGGLGFLAIAVAGVGYAAVSAGKNVLSLEDATKKLAQAQKDVADIKRRDPNGIALGGELREAEDLVKFYEKQIAAIKKVSDANADATKKKAAEGAAAKKTAEELAAIDKKRTEELEKQKKADDERKQAIKALKKEIIDAGKSELQTLIDLRERRLKLAAGDADLRLKIERDFQKKKFELEQKASLELLELRKAQAEYEKKLKDEQLDRVNKGAANPLSSLVNLNDEKDPKKRQDSAFGAGAGLLNSVSGGKAGASALVSEAAAMAIDAFAPGVGQALKPLLGALQQGPEATRAMIKEFADAIPELIDGLVESIPVLLEEIPEQVPIIIDKLIQKIPDIVSAFVRAAPKIIEAQVKEAPKIVAAVVSNVPYLVKSFIEGLTDGAGEFVSALIDAINPFSSSGPVGGIIGGIGDFLGFAEGGSASIRRVPSGFSGDRFPAFLSSDELVVKPDVARDLESFLNNQSGPSSGGFGDSVGILSDILDALKAPQQLNTSINIGERELAHAILQLTRNNQRLF